MSAIDTANRTIDKGRLRSFIVSTRLSACMKSMSFARATVREFTIAASTKIAANKTIVATNASGENTKAKLAFAAMSALKSADVAARSSCEKPMPKASPTASDAAPTMADSASTMRTTPAVSMPSKR